MFREYAYMNIQCTYNTIHIIVLVQYVYLYMYVYKYMYYIAIIKEHNMHYLTVTDA